MSLTTLSKLFDYAWEHGTVDRDLTALLDGTREGALTPELGLVEFPRLAEDIHPWAHGDPNDRVSLIVLADRIYDARRGWRLSAVFFEGKPVMLLQAAGREMDDWTKRFIGYPIRYRAMLAYLRTVCVGDDARIAHDVIDPDATRNDLDSFYSDELNGGWR